MLNAWIMKPVHMEAGKKYPLLITQYSGPNSQQVKNNWSLNWLNYLTQEGFIVACVDPRVLLHAEKNSENVLTCS